MESKHGIAFLPDRMPLPRWICFEAGVAQEGGGIHLLVEVVEELDRAGMPETKPQGSRPDVQVGELGAQQFAIVAEAVDPIEAHFVVLEAGLAEGVIGAAVRGAIAGAERIAQRQRRAPRQLGLPAQPGIKTPTGDVAFEAGRHAQGVLSFLVFFEVEQELAATNPRSVQPVFKLPETVGLQIPGRACTEPEQGRVAGVLPVFLDQLPWRLPAGVIVVVEKKSIERLLPGPEPGRVPK